MLALQDTPPRYQRYPEKHHGSYSQVRRPTRTGYPPDAGAGDDARRTVDWAYAIIRSVLVPNGVLNGVLNGHYSSASRISAIFNPEGPFDLGRYDLYVVLSGIAVHVLDAAVVASHLYTVE